MADMEKDEIASDQARFGEVRSDTTCSGCCASGIIPLSVMARHTRVDSRRVISGIILAIRNDNRWWDMPASGGPQIAIYDHFIRSSALGMFGRIVVELARGSGETEKMKMDTPYLMKAHRTAANLLSGGSPRHIGRTEGRVNSKLHAACDSE